jgi:histone H3/H4
MAKAIIRLGKIKKADLHSVRNHNFRKELGYNEVENADPDKLHLNKTLWGSADFIAGVERNIELHNANNRKLRKDAVVMVDGLATFSPEAASSIDVDSWANDTVEYLKREFGKRLEYAVLHMDEKTPHVHFAVNPIIDEKMHKLSAKQFMTRELFRRVQDDYAAAVAHHGLERGDPKSTAKHITIKEFYGALERADNNLPASDEAKEQLAEAIKKPKPQAVVDAANICLREGRKAIKALNTKLTLAEREKRSLRQSVASMKEETRALRATDCRVVLNAYGASIDPRDRTKYITQSGSISVSKKDPTIWSNFSAEVSSKGAIDLIMHLEDCNFTTARRWLLDNIPADKLGIAADIVNYALDNEPQYKPLEMPALEPDAPRTIQYLTEHRGLQKSLVNDLVRAGYIAETENKGYRNAVFIFKNGGEISGAEIRVNHDGGNCLKRWRAEGSKPGTFFVEGGNDKVAICESPIDAISYVQMHPNCSAIAVGGTQGIEAIKCFMYEHKDEFSTYVAASDNDSGGIAFARKLQKEGIVSEHHAPDSKDWNQDLLDMQHKKQAAQEAFSKPRFKKVSATEQLERSGFTDKPNAVQPPRPTPRP